jgi:VWFA-related protein
MGLLPAVCSEPAFGQQVREQVTVDAVQIRVLAVNGAGAVVEDLAPGDLTLRVDGQIVPIDALALESGPERTVIRAPTTAVPPAPAATDPAPGAASPGAVMILVDESTVNIPLRKEALGQLAEFVAMDARASRFFIASYSLGSLRLDLPWTDDRARVLSTLRKLRDHPTVGGWLPPTTVLEFQMLRARLQTALMQALAMFPDGPMTKQLLLVTGGGTLAPLLDVSGAVVGKNESTSGAPPGRGGDTVPDPGAVDVLDEPLGNGFELWSLAVGGALAQGDNRALQAKAIERDVALVPIATSRIDPVGYGDVARKGRSQVSGLSAQLSTNQALWGLARETGGGSLMLSGKAAGELARRSARAAYLMSFRYGSGGAGRFHKVELTSNRPGVSLEYRRGFRIRTADERMIDAVFAQLVMPDPGANALALAASVAPSPKSTARTLLTLRFSPPGEPGAGAPRAVDVVAVGRDAHGNWTQPARWSGKATAGNGVYGVEIELGIAPGSRAWSIGLRDSLTTVEGYALAAPPKRQR